MVAILPVESRDKEACVHERMLHLSACRTGPDRACARPWGQRRTRSTGRRMDRPSGLDAFPQRPALGGHGSEGRIRRGQRPHSLVRFSGWTVSGGWLGSAVVALAEFALRNRVLLVRASEGTR